MSGVCPAGHRSVAGDYCDVCGLPLDSSAAGPGAGPASALAAPAGSGRPVSSSAPGAARACPHCSAPNPEDALFCEACGYDFTTGSTPRQLAPAEPTDRAAPATSTATGPGPAGFDWVVELWVDPSWYQVQESPDPLPSAGLSAVWPLRGRSVLVGRSSQSRNIHPDVDCESDSGVSRRQCQLSTDGSRWWVEDLESANGTFVGPASGALPEVPVPAGARHELKPDDQVYVGAWTRMALRRATAEEQTTLA